MNKFIPSVVLAMIVALVLRFAQGRYLLVEVDDSTQDDEMLEARSGESWLSCPEGTSKPHTCLPIRDEVLQDQSIDETTGDEKAITFNNVRANNIYKAVRGCKRMCGGKCKAFNVKKRDMGLGFACTFYKTVIDNKNCQGTPGAGAPITTYMKYNYGDCTNANQNTTETCCNENLLK